jgi:type IV secretory pathway TraG/TraD family ATPase VirD4
MVEVASPAKGARNEGFWNNRAQTLLAALLHLAALSKSSMRDVIHWVAWRDGAGLAELLRAVDGSQIAQDEFASIVKTPPEERGGVWGTVQSTLGAYRSDAALASCDEPNFNPKSFVLPYGRPPFLSFATVYITAPAHLQRLVAPLVVSLIEAIRRAAVDAARWEPLPLPLSLILDEAANIAPIPTLPEIVADAGGQGIRIMAAFQDLSQARERWGDRASGFMTLFGEKLILPGIFNKETLNTIRTVMGDYDREITSYNENYGVHPQSLLNPNTSGESWTTHRESLLPESAISQGPGPGTMWWISDGYARPLFMTPWYGAPPWPALEVSAMEQYNGPALPIPALTGDAFTNGIDGLPERYQRAYWRQQQA